MIQETANLHKARPSPWFTASTKFAPAWYLHWQGRTILISRTHQVGALDYISYQLSVQMSIRRRPLAVLSSKSSFWTGVGIPSRKVNINAQDRVGKDAEIMWWSGLRRFQTSQGYLPKVFGNYHDRMSPLASGCNSKHNHPQTRVMLMIYYKVQSNVSSFIWAFTLRFTDAHRHPPVFPVYFGYPVSDKGRI